MALTRSMAAEAAEPAKRAQPSGTACHGHTRIGRTVPKEMVVRRDVFILIIHGGPLAVELKLSGTASRRVPSRYTWSHDNRIHGREGRAHGRRVVER